MSFLISKAALLPRNELTLQESGSVVLDLIKGVFVDMPLMTAERRLYE